jgi:hypothetical protein
MNYPTTPEGLQQAREDELAKEIGRILDKAAKRSTMQATSALLRAEREREFAARRPAASYAA